MAADVPQYRYRTLHGTQIRLLKLIAGPGSPNAELEASLDLVSLPRPPVYELEPSTTEDPGQKAYPDYEALSYYWGDKAKNPFEHFIKILEKNRSYRMYIRPNLETALRQLRYSDHRDRYLWVDALCINQRNEEEKNSQIPRMHEIYNKAKRVIIWLGPEQDNSASAMLFVDKMLNLDIFDRFMQDPQEAQQLANFATLLRRPWFNRRWIVQELAVARDAHIYCGKAEVSWTKFAGAVSLFSSKHVDLKQTFRGSAEFGYSSDYLGDVREFSAYQLVHASSNFFRKSDNGEILERLQSLEDVVSTLATFDASDPRDVIYAVLSLSKDARPTFKKSAFVINEVRADKYFDEHYQGSEVTPPMSPNETYQSPIFSRRPSMHNEKWKGLQSQAPSRRQSMNADGQAEWGADSASSNVRVGDGKTTWRARKAFDQGLKAFLKLQQKTIEVNYKSDVFDVYRVFLELAVSNSQSLDIICRPWAANESDLPSWIPRKSDATFGLRKNRAYSRVKADLLVGSPRTGGKNYSASRDSKASWDYRDHPVLTRSLVVKGFVLDIVAKKELPAMGGIIPGGWLKTFNKLAKKPTDAFWRTLVADRGPEGQKPPPPYYELACKYAFCRQNHHGELDSRELMEDDCPSIVREFLERMRSVVWMRRFIVSEENSLIGLVPLETKKRDKICILEGCSVPVILREYSTGKPKELRDSNGQSTPNVESDLKSRGESPSLVPQHEYSDVTSGAYLNAIPNLQSPIPRRRSKSNVRITLSSEEAEEAYVDLSGDEASVKEALEEAANGRVGTNKDSQSELESKSITVNGEATGDKAKPKAPEASSLQPTTVPGPKSPGPNEETIKPFNRTDSKQVSWNIPRVYYKFIGECYIHGMMDGEAMRFAQIPKEREKKPEKKEREKEQSSGETAGVGQTKDSVQGQAQEQKQGEKPEVKRSDRKQLFWLR